MLAASPPPILERNLAATCLDYQYKRNGVCIQIFYPSCLLEVQRLLLDVLCLSELVNIEPQYQAHPLYHAVYCPPSNHVRTRRVGYNLYRSPRPHVLPPFS